MAEEPSSVQGLDRRFAGVNSQISVGVGLLMTVLSVGGYALWSEFHGLKADFARARGDTDVIKEQAADQRARLTRLDEKLDKNLAEIVRSNSPGRYSYRIASVHDHAGTDFALRRNDP